MFTAADHAHMARALRLARCGLWTTTPNPRVGCVIVKEGVIVGEGWHVRAGEAHAEVHALRTAGDRARGATAYVTLEPCSHHGRTPPCAEALIDAGLARVVAAMTDPNPQVAGQGMQLLTLAGIRAEIGLLEAEARELNLGFISRMTRHRPWLRLKTASSLDGRTALANGASQWITGPQARADVQRWRARSCAILTGIGTVRADDPQMNVRDLDVCRQPLRVIVDSGLNTPPNARILASPSGGGAGGEGNSGAVLIACVHADPQRRAAIEASGAEVLIMAPGLDGRIDLPLLLAELARRGCNEVHAEAGATLNGALLHAGLVDEWLAYLAPMAMGNPARGLFDVPELTAVPDCPRFKTHDLRQLGDDIRLTLRPA